MEQTASCISQFLITDQILEKAFKDRKEIITLIQKHINYLTPWIIRYCFGIHIKINIKAATALSPRRDNNWCNHYILPRVYVFHHS